MNTYEQSLKTLKYMSMTNVYKKIYLNALHDIQIKKIIFVLKWI